MIYPDTFDVIVVGGGHAGTEAALAAARIGARTLLLTQQIETIGQMSCNPAIGGIGKGHLVREIDALGGAMASAADRAGIQFRTLNARKGPAVRATRAQADRQRYRHAIRAAVEGCANLQLFQQSAEDLVVEGGRVCGVVTQMGLIIRAQAVVLTAGTFLAGRIHIGDHNYQGGRAGDPASIGLAERLRALDLGVARLKTGTPPRLDARSLDYSQMAEQPGDNPTPIFSYLGSRADQPRQVSCHITYTNPRTHEIIQGALHRSAMYSGQIEGVGPRYCPSIEDKVVRFADKDRHQIFVEPEGLDTYEVYPNGLSTSLPFDVQIDYIRSIPGFEQAQITRPGYAIEYDFFDPRGLSRDLSSRQLPGLYLAGQINGTTGYEEAAAQGLLAGCNAALAVQQKDPWLPGRELAYMGVMMDDLITCGTAEPYRMFTSRAEHRLLLREDNADLRLTPIGRQLGLVDDLRWAAFETRQNAIEAEIGRLRATTLRPRDIVDAQAAKMFAEPLSREYKLDELLRRPEVDYTNLMRIPAAGPGVQREDIVLAVQVAVKYQGYIERQQEEVARAQRQETQPLPEDIDYAQVDGLSNEVRQKLQELRPETLGMAGRIPGVTPAAVSLLSVYLRKRELAKARLRA